MRKKKPRFPRYTTVIGRGSEIRGDVRFAGGLHVDGKVEGNVSCVTDETCGITLGAGGVIKGNVRVPYVILDGTVVGDVFALVRAELAPGARIDGTLYYGVLEMHEGAEVNGKLVHVSDQETPPSQGEGGGADGRDRDSGSATESGRHSSSPTTPGTS